MGHSNGALFLHLHRYAVDRAHRPARRRPRRLAPASWALLLRRRPGRYS